MDCPTCSQPLENGAAFCGNCGQAIVEQPQLIGAGPVANVARASSKSDETIATVLTNGEHSTFNPVYNGIGSPLVAATLSPGAMPAYAVPVVGQQRDHMRAALSLVFGLLAVVGAMVMPLVGLLLGLVGVILGTLSRRYLKRGLGLAGLIISSIGILVAMASWVYVVSHAAEATKVAQTNVSKTNTSAVVAANVLSTPCYDISFVNRLNVQNANGSCNMNAFDGSTLDVSKSAYKVFATASAVSPTGFTGLAKAALDRDISQSMPDYHITNETTTQFSGSPAYIVTTSNGAGVSLLEAAVLHSGSASGNNFYVIIYATTSGTASLHDLELGWQWK